MFTPFFYRFIFSVLPLFLWRWTGLQTKQNFEPHRHNRHIGGFHIEVLINFFYVCISMYLCGSGSQRPNSSTTFRVEPYFQCNDSQEQRVDSFLKYWIFFNTAGELNLFLLTVTLASLVWINFKPMKSDFFRLTISAIHVLFLLLLLSSYV